LNKEHLQSSSELVTLYKLHVGCKKVLFVHSNHIVSACVYDEFMTYHGVLLVHV